MDLTLMAVHAHPDDEVLSTGGVLARYADEGVRTVLVTCTNGEQGDAPGGIKPGEPGHDPAEVAALRLGELRDSAAELGIAHVELLGYADSGMEGWQANSDPEAFTNVPVDVAAERLAALMKQYRPQVLISYDENGGYGHPDHIQAHRVARAAAESSAVPQKAYYSAISRSAFATMFEETRKAGIDLGFEPPDDSEMGAPDEVVTTSIDVSAYAERKRKALAAHGSQGDSIFFLGLPVEIQHRFYGLEQFIRVQGDGPDAEDDLFAGLRP